MLRLRTYKNSDADKLVTWFSDEETFQKWAAGKLEWPINADTFRFYAAELLKEENVWLATAVDEAGTPVGFLCMSDINYQKNSVHFSMIIVSDKYRGKGYGSQMLKLAIRYATELLGMKRITIRVFENNEGAKKCYERLGFRYEAYYPEALKWKNHSWGAFDVALEWQNN